MGKIVGVLVCLVILALDITAGILGIKAEAAQNQVYLFNLHFYTAKNMDEMISIVHF